MDDMIVKSMFDVKQGQDLRKTFEILRTYGMKVNLKKCVFGVWSRKVLGFMISSHDIEANPDKVKAALHMKPPRNIKEVQRLTGCITALGSFLSRFFDKCQPFSKYFGGQL